MTAKVCEVIGSEGRYMSLNCPGCKNEHMLKVGGGVHPNWTFNENLDAPTFQPSLLVRSGHCVPGHDGGDCWCNFEARTGRKPSFSCGICHSFITDGQIQFLSDSTHALSGQTVPLPDWVDD